MNELTERGSGFYSFLENSCGAKWLKDIYFYGLSFVKRRDGRAKCRKMKKNLSNDRWQNSIYSNCFACRSDKNDEFLFFATSFISLVPLPLCAAVKVSFCASIPRHFVPFFRESTSSSRHNSLLNLPYFVYVFCRQKIVCDTSVSETKHERRISRSRGNVWEFFFMGKSFYFIVFIQALHGTEDALEWRRHKLKWICEAQRLRRQFDKLPMRGCPIPDPNHWPSLEDDVELTQNGIRSEMKCGKMRVASSFKRTFQ